MLKPYSRTEWGISHPEYNMLIEAMEKGIVTEHQIDANRLFFVWGEYTALKFIKGYCPQGHYVTKIKPIRIHVSQKEFELICSDVVSYYNDVSIRSCDQGVLKISFPSNTGRSINGATIDFNDGGFITGKITNISADRNLAESIAKRVQNKISSARYET